MVLMVFHLSLRTGFPNPWGQEKPTVYSQATSGLCCTGFISLCLSIGTFGSGFVGLIPTCFCRNQPFRTVHGTLLRSWTQVLRAKLSFLVDLGHSAPKRVCILEWCLADVQRKSGTFGSCFVGLIPTCFCRNQPFGPACAQVCRMRHR